MGVSVHCCFEQVGRARNGGGNERLKVANKFGEKEKAYKASRVDEKEDCEGVFFSKHLYDRCVLCGVLREREKSGGRERQRERERMRERG